jgi:tRNA(Arg) A34 adenosine deaminase TadA
MEFTEKRFNFIVNKATEIAEKSTCKKSKHSAVLFNKGNIISTGYNQYGHTRVLGYNIPTLHAEMHCLLHIFPKKKKFFEEDSEEKYKVG